MYLNELCANEDGMPNYMNIKKEEESNNDCIVHQNTA